jgi:hypothetical protein
LEIYGRIWRLGSLKIAQRFNAGLFSEDEFKLSQYPFVTSSITAKGDTTTLTMTMRFPGSP